MADDWRKQWQSFKKKHPKFEQSKNFKSDVGPQMDDFEAALYKILDLFADFTKAMPKAWADQEKVKNKLELAVRDYRKILSSDDMKDDDSAVKDFGLCMRYGALRLYDLRQLTSLVREHLETADKLNFTWE